MPSKRMFGIKDVFTSINLLGGVVGIALCIDGKPFEAGVAVLLGYVFGDAVDGWVARKLGTSNEFGAELDTIADHTSHVIAPAAIVYTVYRDVGLVAAPWDQVLAIALAMSMVLSVSVRHARNIVAPVAYKGVWAGLPRTVLGFWAIGYCNAELAPDVPGGWWLGVVIIPVLGLATLTYLPFPSHHIARRHYWWVNGLLLLFFFATMGSLIFARDYVFDVIFVIMTIYSFIAWTSLTSDERRDYNAAVAVAKQI
jgi:phosphatidylserine synthase